MNVFRNDHSIRTFEELKVKRATVLTVPDFNTLLKLAVDASEVAAGALLLQDDEEGGEDPACDFSKKFNKNQRNYLTIEK